ncbi:hypothetical protein GCM10022380_51200 [Amycolatopsis tucumanensis]|uniref:Uncharacterized protein n=1 Tax=Amycolatopsis tucumanensis TaxID=401106 RepID=A0ABP7IT02_9PSEU
MGRSRAAERRFTASGGPSGELPAHFLPGGGAAKPAGGRIPCLSPGHARHGPATPAPLAADRRERRPPGATAASAERCRLRRELPLRELPPCPEAIAPSGSYRPGELPPCPEAIAATGSYRPGELPPCPEAIAATGSYRPGELPPCPEAIAATRSYRPRELPPQGAGTPPGSHRPLRKPPPPPGATAPPAAPTIPRPGHGRAADLVGAPG